MSLTAQRFLLRPMRFSITSGKRRLTWSPSSNRSNWSKSRSSSCSTLLPAAISRSMSRFQPTAKARRFFPSWITAPPLWEAAKCAAGCANRFVRWKILRPATMPSKRSWATNPRANTSLPYWMRSRMSNALPPASVWVPSVRESSPRFATRSPRFQRLALRSLTRRLTLLPASAGA